MSPRRSTATSPSRRHEAPRARSRPRTVDLDDPRSVPASGRRSRRSTWSRTTTSPDARVRGRGPRGTRTDD